MQLIVLGNKSSLTLFKNIGEYFEVVYCEFASL